jgi:hypothetical protein
MSFTLRFATAFAVLLSVALPARAARADGPSSPPGFYVRALIGPDAMIGAHHVRSYFATSGGPYSYDETVTMVGAQLAVAAGWALGPRTALAVDGAVRLEPALLGPSPTPLTGGGGYHVAALVDHYVTAERGLHAQLGAGLEAFGFDGNFADPTGPGPAAGLGVQQVSYNPSQTAFGPMLLTGVGYDSSWFGVCARVEAAYLTTSEVRLVPVHVSLNVSALYF